jgi:glutamate synthase (NADPH/NADH) small chain
MHMIESLHYLPIAGGTHDALSERFTDLAPPLTARQAAIESARCLYCYDAPCTPDRHRRRQLHPQHP